MNMKDCIDNCTECHRVCLEALTYCLTKGGAHAEASHILALIDCAQACTLSADFMLRGSALHDRSCALCAEACERCAASCDKFGNDAKMKACAEICRRCAKSCHEMAGHAH
jgi:hypothetical protein